MMGGVVLGDIVRSNSSFRVGRRLLRYQVFIIVESVGLVTLGDRGK
jgi:hypothetical protein